jgi:FixJ family two-component response regulator
MQAPVSEISTSAPTARGLSRENPLHIVGGGRATQMEVVYLIDRDRGAVESLSRTMSERGTRVVAFAAPAEYLRHLRTDSAACLVVDADQTDMGLLQPQSQLGGRTNPPVVITGSQSDVNSAVQAMKAGAIEFLTKPIDAEAMVVAVRTAFDQDRMLRRRRAELAELQVRFSRLTPREREVFSLIAGGLLNKQAAAHLGISDITVQIHRGQVMRKMEATSFAELVRFAVKLRIPCWREARKPSERHLIA